MGHDSLIGVPPEISSLDGAQTLIVELALLAKAAAALAARIADLNINLRNAAPPDNYDDEKQC